MDIADQGNVDFNIFGMEEKDAVKICIPFSEIINCNLIILLLIMIDNVLKGRYALNGCALTYFKYNIVGRDIITFEIA